jgi:hypothetical protein
MPIEFVEERGNLIISRFRGMVAYDDWQVAQTQLARKIDRLGAIRILVILDDFSGWEHSEGWGDLGFFQTYDEAINSIAIVGERKWEDDFLIFSFAGLRKAPVHFFEEEGEAISWLEEQV